MADELERKGLVLRERDPDDRRAWQLRLTADGESARRELIDTTVRLVRQITGLDTDELERLGALMDAVAERILENGFPKDKVQHIFRPRKKDIAAEIVKLVKEGRYTVVVLNHRPGKITRLFTGSTFYRVVGELKGVTACIVT